MFFAFINIESFLRILESLLLIILWRLEINGVVLYAHDSLLGKLLEVLRWNLNNRVSFLFLCIERTFNLLVFDNNHWLVVFIEFLSSLCKWNVLFRHCSLHLLLNQGFSEGRTEVGEIAFVILGCARLFSSLKLVILVSFVWFDWQLFLLENSLNFVRWSNLRATEKVTVPRYLILN